jgi:hypothetical protein
VTNFSTSILSTGASKGGTVGSDALSIRVLTERAALSLVNIAISFAFSFSPEFILSGPLCCLEVEAKESTFFFYETGEFEERLPRSDSQNSAI